MAKKQAESHEDVIARLNAKYGSGSLMSGDEKPDLVESIPHLSLGYNLATGIWGTPFGKLIMVDAEEHVGKSTLVLEIIASYQKAGKKCVYMDFEYAFNKEYAKKLGVDTSKLTIAQPTTLEDGYNMSVALLEAKVADLIVIDSVNAMIPKAILEGEIGDATIAVAARLHAQALPKIKALLSVNDASMILVSQYRTAIGSMSPSAGKSSGVGKAMKFMVDQRIQLTRFSTKKEDGYYINNIEFVKNKVSSPYQKYKMIYSVGEGVDRVRELLEYGKELGLIKQAGAWYSHGETKLGGGINAVKDFFESNPEYFDQVFKEVEQALREA